MEYIVTSIPFLLAFALCFAAERRRLVNGVLLLIGLLLLTFGLLDVLSRLPGGHDLVATLVPAVFMLTLFGALPAFLLANGMLMFRREGRRLGNLLSLLAGLAIPVCMMATLAVGKQLVPGWVAKVITTAGIVVGYLSLAFVTYLLYSVVYVHVRRRSTVDYIVVHGSRLIRSKVPPLLASRLDRARRIFDEQTANGTSPMIITSGGQGGDEELPEARAMADYLIEAGVPADHILLEDRSTTTRENLIFSKEIMTARDPRYRSVLVTNNFHAFRTALLAREIKLNGEVVGSRTAWYYIPSASIREFAAILRDHWIFNAVVVAALVLAYLLWPSR
ncbi:YdcF family protein [Amycolatopsis sp. NPDC059657]|uniref:YdcF family protein n=1 Tax=Amycolatopsis sp. NPDC059657 TaxID=3346899 RepID=UPI00366D0778